MAYAGVVNSPRNTATDAGVKAVAESAARPRLTSLEAGQKIPFGGSYWVEVSADLAGAFQSGDHLVVVQESGDLLHIPRAVVDITAQAVESALQGFIDLQDVSAAAISGFYESFARRLDDDQVFAAIAQANADDVRSAELRGRSTTRLLLDDKMRRSMIEALAMWRNTPDTRHRLVDRIEHGESEKDVRWSVDEIRSPLGVVGFVFEGRPNVFADATGVLRSGNSVVFRIGSDALGTARAMMEKALIPSLLENGLPIGSVVLLDSPERSAGHALFSHTGLSLAVARGSGTAVAQLGAVARQSGIPVSLHGTGGAWMVVAPSADTARLADCVEASLDRKVCNTLNVCCLPRHRADLVEALITGALRAAERAGEKVRLHVVGAGTSEAVLQAMTTLDTASQEMISIVDEEADEIMAWEWEWEKQPEFTVRLVENWLDGVSLFNDWSPQFVVSVLSGDEADLDEVFRRANAPFVGNGFTRWVDGQYALKRPELGLSNWQTGRLFARGGILSGDGVYSVRYLARHENSQQRR